MRGSLAWTSLRVHLIQDEFYRYIFNDHIIWVVEKHMLKYYDKKNWLLLEEKKNCVCKKKMNKFASMWKKIN